MIRDILYAFCFALLILGTAQAQRQNRVTDKIRGVEFSIPDGWEGDRTQEGYAFQSASTAGILLILYHDYNDANALADAALAGVVDEEGTSLSVDGDITEYGKTGIQAGYAGTIQWEPAAAYAVGLVSPHGGGLSIIAASARDAFSEGHKRAVQALANSVVFTKPDAADLVQEWKTFLAGMKLTYMESYNSGGGSGGYSNETVIDLCPTGSFGFRSNSSVAVNSGGGGAYSGGQRGGAGTWTVAPASGKIRLVLQFHSGETSSYTLEYKDDKLYLNGTRYFRTNDAACY